MSYINKYLRNFTPYKLASHRIWQVSPKERDQVLKLDWNEATIPPSPMVAERIKNIVEQGNFYNYYPATLNEELLQLLSKYLDLPQENVQYFGSSDALHEYIAKMYISVGDPILIIWPSYDNFRLTAEVNGGVVYYSRMSADFSISQEQIREDIRRVEPSLVYICNPNNPTGHLYSVEFIESLLKEFTDVIFLLDEAYSEFSKVTAKDLVLKYENILISRTMSKAFGIANFRFGYLIASEKNVSYLSTIRNPKNITTFAQEAAIGVLSDIPYMTAYVEEVIQARIYFIRQLKRYRDFIQVYDSAGNYVMVRCLKDELKQKLIDRMEKNNIYIRNLSQDEIVSDCLRITIGTTKQMERVIAAMDLFFTGRCSP